MVTQSLGLSGPQPGMDIMAGTLSTSCKVLECIRKMREQTQVLVPVLHWLLKSGLTLDVAEIVFLARQEFR